MSSQTFDAIRRLRIGPSTIPFEILPGDRATVTMEGGHVKVVKADDTLSIAQGSASTARASAHGAGNVSVKVSVTSTGTSGTASATIQQEKASASSKEDLDAADLGRNGQIPSKITVHLPEGTAIEVSNYVNGTFRVGAIKGPLTIQQMVNTQIAVDEVTDLVIKMLVNCHGYIHATGKIESGMMVNSHLSID